MGRKALVHAPKSDPLDKFTKDRMEMAAQVLTAVGAGVVTHAMIWKTQRGMQKQNAFWTSNSPFSMNPLEIIKGQWFKAIPDAINEIREMLKSDVTLFDGIQKNIIFAEDRITFISNELDTLLRNLYDNHKKNCVGRTPREIESLQFAYEAERKIYIDRAAANTKIQTDLITKYRREQAPYIMAIEENSQIQNEMKYGASLLVAGAFYWLLCHPDVVKQGISSAEKITCKAIDEMDQLVKAITPSIATFIGL